MDLSPGGVGENVSPRGSGVVDQRNNTSPRGTGPLLAPNMVDEAWVRQVLEKTKVSADVERKRKDVLERLQKAVDYWIQNDGELVRRTVSPIGRNQQGNPVDGEGSVDDQSEGLAVKRRVEVVAYGSTVMGISNPQSDIDASLVVPGCNPEDKVKVLKRIDRVMNSIWKGTRKSVELRARARVPVLHYMDAIHKLHCDVTVTTGGSAYKSKAIGLLLDYDKRAVGLVKLVKLWAKSEGINDPSNGTFNSFSLVLLVIVYLQCQRPRVLPPLKDILFSPNIASQCTAIEKKSTERCGNEAMWSILLQNIQTHGNAWKSQNGKERNQKLLSELLKDFFVFYDHRLGRYRPCMRACAYHGKITSTSLAQTTRHLDVVDPFDEDQNCARTILKFASFKKIQKSFKAAASSTEGDQRSLTRKICQANKWHVVDCLNGIANMRLEERTTEDHATAPSKKKREVDSKTQKAIPRSTQHDKPRQPESTSQPGQKPVAQYVAKMSKTKGTLVMVGQKDDSQLKSNQDNAKPPTHAQMYYCPFCPFSCSATDIPSRKRHKKETRHVWNRLLYLYKEYIVQDERSVRCSGCSNVKCSMKSKKKILEFEKHVRLLQLWKGKKPQNWKTQCSVPHIQKIDEQTAYKCTLCSASLDASNVCGILALLQHTAPHTKIK
mmetsp:Transcript_3435/g.21505  ORF Transcript_3435/g.21505 Transcript_3435/m.21505 type:complete len:663 (+) Transcript_3435:3-1991(+)